MRIGGRPLWLGGGIALVGALLSLNAAVLALDESAGLGALFALRGGAPVPDDVVLVSISADSAEAFGVDPRNLNDWPRSLHARLIERLAEAGARVVALDLIFDRPSDPADDARLAGALERAGRSVLLDRIETEAIGPGAVATLDRRRLPVEPLRRAAAASAPFVLPAVPVRTTRFWTFGRSAAALPNLPTVALQLFLLDAYADFVARLCAQGADCRELPSTADALLAHDDPAVAMARIRDLFERDPALAARMRDAGTPETRTLVDLYAGPASRVLNYYGPAGTVPTIPMHEIVLAPPGRRAPLDGIAGKAVFVGFAETRQPEQQDEFYTVFSERSGQDLSGAEIGATAFANLLSGTTLRTPGMPAQLALVVAFGFALGAAARPAPLMAAVGAGTAAAVAYGGWAGYGFMAHELWLPLVVPLGAQWPLWLLALLALRYRDELTRRARVERALGQYVPARQLRRLVRETRGGGPAAELLDGVCLYTDAEQFTRVAERLAPEALARLMNEYYQLLCDAAERHGGLVADLSGDSMVSIWAAAGSAPALADRAVAAALAIAADADAFEGESDGQRMPTRIGLDAGRLLLGDVGSRARREYRAVGEIVTTAARIQGLNRLLGTRVLMSDAVAAAVHGFASRRLGRFLLLGKTTPIVVHEVVGAPAATAASADWIAGFERGVDRFVARDWPAAMQAFEAVLALRPADGPAGFYIDRCLRFAEHPPPPDWTGSLRIDVK